MPELDLSTAVGVRIAGYDALAVRVANVDIWERAVSAVEHSVFGASPLTGYQMYNDMDTNGWLGANFYTTGIPHLVGWQIVGARIWVPLDYAGPALGLPGYVALHRTDDSIDGAVVGQPGAPSDGHIINGFETNGSKTPFTNLHTGWNEVYFNETWPLTHGNGFAIGYQIGDGRYYSYGPTVAEALRYASDGTNLLISEHDTGTDMPKTAEYGVPGGYASFSGAHYGIDVIVREPATLPTGEHTIWNTAQFVSADYRVNNDLPTDSWATSHFYLQSSAEEPTEHWELVGARLWLPQGIEQDPYSLAGKTALCGYYIHPSGPIGDHNNTPIGVITAVSSSTLKSTSLVRGWNSVYFDTPISIPWGAGIAIGWKIDDGTYYIHDRRGDAPVQSHDALPFYLSGSEHNEERRGAFNLTSTTASWSYQDYHYGADLIVKKVV